MGESSIQSAESGSLGNYSTTGDFAIDSLNGINEPEEVMFRNQMNTWNRIIWIQSKKKMTALHFQKKGMIWKKSRMEDVQMPMNMELLHNPHRIREIPRSRSGLRGQKQVPEILGAWRIKLWITKDKRIPLLMRGVK